MRDTTSSITIHIAGEANHAALLPNAAIVHNEQIAKSKQNNDFLIVLLYRQLSLYRQSTLIRDANSEHALTDLRHFLYVKERTEVTILSWGKEGKDLTYTPKIAGLLPYFGTNFSARYNFSASNLNRLRPHIKNIFTFLVMVKKKDISHLGDILSFVFRFVLFE